MANRWTIGQDKVRNRADGNVQINKHDPIGTRTQTRTRDSDLAKLFRGQNLFCPGCSVRALAVSLLFRSCRGQLFKMRKPR